MDYTIIALVLLTVLIGTVSSFMVYLYMKMDKYLNDIHHRIDGEVKPMFCSKNYIVFFINY